MLRQEYRLYVIFIYLLGNNFEDHLPVMIL